MPSGEEAPGTENELGQTENELGQEITLERGVLTAFAVSDEPSTDFFPLEKQYNKLVAVAISLQNSSDQALPFKVSNFYLKNEVGSRFSAVRVKEPQFPSDGSLAPGEKVRGWVTYEVAKGSTGYFLIYYPAWAPGELEYTVKLK